MQNKLKKWMNEDYLRHRLAVIAEFVFHPRYLIYRLTRKYIKHYEQFAQHINTSSERTLLKKMIPFQMTTLFDVGAYVGEWLLMAREYFPSATIHAFEISKDTFKQLKKNAHQKNIILNNFGLAHKNDTVPYRDYDKHAVGNTVLDAPLNSPQFGKADVKKTTIKTGHQYCQDHHIDHIDFVKIDVEGAEYLVLQGLIPLLKKQKITVIQFEYGYTSGDLHFLMKDFYNFFAGYGYSVGPLKKTGVLFGSFSYYLNNFNSGPNFVAVLSHRQDIIDAIRGTPIVGYPISKRQLRKVS